MQADSIAHTSTYTSGPAVPLSQPPDNTSVCIDIHTAMVATDPGEKLLIGRCPVRNWTRSTISSLFLFTSVLRKINITCCHQSYTYKCGLLRLLQCQQHTQQQQQHLYQCTGKMPPANSTTDRPWLANSLCRHARPLHCWSQITQNDCNARDWLDVVNCSQLHCPVKGFVVSSQQRFVVRQLPDTNQHRHFTEPKKQLIIN